MQEALMVEVKQLS